MTSHFHDSAAMAAFASTALISIAPNVLLLLFPHYASGEGEHSFALSLGQAIAAGGLLGDVFLHVIPHSAASHDMGLWILLGFFIFLVTDVFIRQLSMRGSGASHVIHAHQHGKGTSVTATSSTQKSSHEHPEHKKSLVLLNLAADALHNVSFSMPILEQAACNTTVALSSFLMSFSHCLNASSVY